MTKAQQDTVPAWKNIQTLNAKETARQFLAIADGRDVYDTLNKLPVAAVDKIETALYAIAQERDHQTAQQEARMNELQA